MANKSVYVTPTQPSLKGSKIPHGHVSLNSKYHSSDLEKRITESGVRIIYDDAIGLIDCYPSTHCAVVVLQECHIINEIETKQKIKKLTKFAHCKVVLVEITDISQQYFKELQMEMLYCDQKINMVPCASIKDIALMIKQLGQVDGQANQFTGKNTSHPPHEESIINFLTSFPGVGEKKALELLKKFQNIGAISTVSTKELAQVVGQATAESMKKAFTVMT